MARNCEYKWIKKAASGTTNNDSSEQNMESEMEHLSDTNRMNVPLHQQECYHGKVIVRGSIYQGHHMLGVDSEGRQCSFIVLSVFIFNHAIPARYWESDKIDEIIHFSDRMYSHALTCGGIPNTTNLLVSHLPEGAKSSDGTLHTIKYEN